MKKFDPLACTTAMPALGVVFHFEATIPTQAATHAAAGVRPKPAL